MLLELAAVLVPWLVPAIVAPVLLFVVRLAIRLIETGSNARKKIPGKAFLPAIHATRILLINGGKEKMYGVYNVYLNSNTRNWDGLEWVIDGERGRDSFPGTWEKEKVIAYYRRGWSWTHKEA